MRAMDKELKHWNDRQRALDRLDGQKMPGNTSKAAVTYMWVMNEGEEEGESLVRKRLRQDDIQAYWYPRHTLERIYELIEHAWDLCKSAGNRQTCDRLKRIYEEDADDFLENYRDMLVDGKGGSKAEEVQSQMIAVTGQAIRGSGKVKHSGGTEMNPEEEEIVGVTANMARMVFEETLLDILKLCYSFQGDERIEVPMDESLISHNICLKNLVH